jgi:ribosome-binding protein aMBF1 (putative translation factor)
MTTDGYHEVWQTWTLVQRTPVVEEASSATSGPLTSNPIVRMRERMQIARVRRRLSISELAARVDCDVHTLSGFERGDEVVDDVTQRRIAKILGL